MMQAVKWLYLMTLAVWIGSIVFFSFAVAPTVFKVLQPEDAARLQRAMFPKYYAVGIVCAAIGLGCVGAMLVMRAIPRGVAVLSVVILFATLGGTDLCLRQLLVPRMTALREQRQSARSSGHNLDALTEQQWQLMHRLSVQINAAVLLGGAVLVFLFVITGNKP